MADEIEKMDRNSEATIKEMLSKVIWLDYALYAKFKRKIVFGDNIE